MPQVGKKELTYKQIHKELSNFQFSSRVKAPSKRSPVNQQFICMWFYDEHLSKDIEDEMKIYLNQTFSYVKHFTDPIELMNYLKCAHVRTIFFISNSENTEELCNLIKQLKKFDCLYRYELKLDSDQSPLTNSKDWAVCHSVDELFKHISIDIKNNVVDLDQLERQCEEEITIEDLIPTFGLFNSHLEEKSFHFISNDSLKFLLFRLSFQVLIGMNHDAFALDEMCSYCRNQYKLNTTQLQNIDQFRGKYNKDQAIYYYTEDSFVYRLINQAFRSEDIDRIFKCRHYITHLHQHLAKQANQQGTTISEKYVYRGQKLPIVVLQQLKDNEGSLISMNGFLSVTKSSVFGAQYACVGTETDKYASVIFDMEIDQTKIITMPCADITAQSKFPHEGEILFSIGSVWYLESVDEDSSYWTIKLKFCNGPNSQLTKLDDQLTKLDDQLTKLDDQLTKLDERLTNGFTYLSLGNILRELGDKPNAENFYHRMLDDPTLSYETRGHIYYNIGTLAAEQGRYGDALKNIQKAKELIPSRTVLSDRQETTYELVYSYNRLPSRLRIVNMLGLLYQKKGVYEAAHWSFTQALREEGHALEKAIVNNNLGLLEFDYGKYEQSLKHHTEAIELAQNYVWLKELWKNRDRVKKHLFQMNQCHGLGHDTFLPHAFSLAHWFCAMLSLRSISCMLFSLSWLRVLYDVASHAMMCTRSTFRWLLF